MNSSLLLTFLLINVFLIGVFVAIAFRHVMAHFRPQPHDEPPAHKPQIDQAKLPPAVKERLLKTAEIHFEAVLTHATGEFHKDLKDTAARLNKQLAAIGTTMIDHEMKDYRAKLAELTKQLEVSIQSNQADLTTAQNAAASRLVEQRAELDSKLAEEMAAEKELLRTQIDTKLADAVSSFLLETLGHNVDLGTQTAYITSMLDEHKAELIKEVGGEA